MATSILQQLLALYFVIIYSWLLSRSEKTLVGEKSHPYISRILQISFTQILFFHFLRQLFVYLTGHAKHMLCSEQTTVLLARKHLNTMLLTNFENLNSISYIFQEKHDFLVFTNPVILCIYLRTRQFCDQENVHHSTSKLLKCDLVQTLNTFRNLCWRIFAAGKASLLRINKKVRQSSFGRKATHLKSLKQSCLIGVISETHRAPWHQFDFLREKFDWWVTPYSFNKQSKNTWKVDRRSCCLFLSPNCQS